MLRGCEPTRHRPEELPVQIVRRRHWEWRKRVFRFERMAKFIDPLSDLLLGQRDAPGFDTIGVNQEPVRALWPKQNLYDGLTRLQTGDDIVGRDRRIYQLIVSGFSGLHLPFQIGNACVRDLPLLLKLIDLRRQRPRVGLEHGKLLLNPVPLALRILERANKAAHFFFTCRQPGRRHRHGLRHDRAAHQLRHLQHPLSQLTVIATFGEGDVEIRPRFRHPDGVLLLAVNRKAGVKRRERLAPTTLPGIDLTERQLGLGFRARSAEQPALLLNGQQQKVLRPAEVAVLNGNLCLKDQDFRQPFVRGTRGSRSMMSRASLRASSAWPSLSCSTSI